MSSFSVRAAVLKKIFWVLAAVALVVAMVAGPTRLQEFFLPAPRVPADWRALLESMRAFERRIGFRATDNFMLRSATVSGYTSCGYAPRLTLPYSYEDPAIRWSDVTDEQACRAAANGDDVYFTHLEAIGESATAVTQRMIRGKLERFLYLVIHEDCHDQFDFPFGFEEALCNVLSYAGLAAFAREKYGMFTRERRALLGYAREQARLTHAVVRYYRRIDHLYARHARGEIAAEAALIERARVFGAAERTLGWYPRTLNNVGLANEMTYSRHYPLIERVHDRLGGDLAKTVAFFKAVDRAKPAAETVMQSARISDKKSIRFVRAYEAAMVDTVHQQLAAAAGGAAGR